MQLIGQYDPGETPHLRGLIWFHTGSILSNKSCANTGTEFVQAICRTSDSIDPGETPHLRGLIWVCTDQTSHKKTLQLNLLKQHVEH